jgi:RNA polymerase sigma factor (sigma-70 family)
MCEKVSDAHESSLAESIFAEVRPRLFAIAYRTVGDVAEAEDMVQEAWIKWQNCDRTTVRDPRAFLAAATARLSSNAAQSARARHETYIHTWLREPVDTTGDPALAAERAEALEFAMRLTLELSPSERAAYVLRHAFDYPYARIAEITHQTQASVRQHVSRARKHLAGRKRAAISAGNHQQLLDAFVAGAQDGNLIALEQLLAADVRHEVRCGPARIDTSVTRNPATRSHAGLATARSSDSLPAHTGRGR